MSWKSHQDNNGRIIRDLLSFKDKLVFNLTGQVRVPQKSGKKCTRDEISQDTFDANRLVNVGNHLPGKGVGTNHTCTVCRKKKICWLEVNKDKDPDECPLKVPKSTHDTFMKSFGIELSDDDKRLPYLYWTPKLHKSPVKHRFIAGSSKCTTKQLSSLLTKILTVIKTGLEKYCSIKTSNTGVNNNVDT